MKLFYSYCHVDEKYRERLEKFLVTLRDEGKITEWHDRKIMPGDKWQDDIKQNLENSDIVLLLISQDFLSSSACKEEIQFALNPDNKKITIPIILKPCTWLHTALKDIQAVPTDGRPILNWESEDSAWLDVAEKITAVIDSFSEKVKKSFLYEINKTEFRNSEKECIKLSDIFVNPSFDFSTIDGKNEKREFIIEEFLTEKNKYSLISGESLSGKTSVLYRLYEQSVKKDFYPILIDGNTIKKTRNFEEIIQKALREQYENFTLNIFWSKRNKILLIDNYSHSVSDNIINWGKEKFDYIYIAIDANELLIFFKDSKVFADFNNCSIRNMGHTSRYELIKNWKTIERNNYTTEEQFQNEIDVLEQHIDSIILNKNILPNTPFYILTIIQSFETFMPQDFQITSYGHCYYAIIYAQLSSIGLSQSDIDDSLNYFTQLAKRIFDKAKNNQWVLSLESYNEFKKAYKNDYLIGDGMVARLEEPDCLLLKINNADENISFTYPFVFYYFLGKYLAAHKEQKIIEDLCTKIYNRDFANILIFTVHHTINTDLLDEIELHCLISLENFDVAKLTTEETSFMNGLMTTLPKEIEMSRSSKSPEEQRLLSRREQDKIEDETAELNVNDINENSDPEMKEIERSMKIIEVLGQIIKNRSGSFKKTEIKELIFEVEKLGLRILTYFLNTLKSPEFKEWIFERISILEKERGNYLEKGKIEKIVEQNVEMMGFVIIIGILQRTYLSLSTQKILSLQKEISDNENSVAFDFLFIFFKLNYEGIKSSFIEHYYRKFNDSKNSWAENVLMLLVKSYLDSHNVEYKERAKILSLFGLKYKPNKVLPKK